MKYVRNKSSGSIYETDDPGRGGPDYETLPNAAGKRALRDEARKTLAEHLKPGDSVYTTVRNVSRSGMSRSIDLYLIGKDRQPWRISYLVARATEHSTDNRGAVKISGCGMNMCFELVYALSRVLFRDGFKCAGKTCPSNDHSNGDRNRRPSHKHTDGGYALRQRDL